MGDQTDRGILFAARQPVGGFFAPSANSFSSQKTLETTLPNKPLL